MFLVERANMTSRRKAPPALLVDSVYSLFPVGERPVAEVEKAPMIEVSVAMW